jgi:hypothetical protein
MTISSEPTKTHLKPGQFACPQCGHCDWHRLVDFASVSICHAEVLLMPHGVSVTETFIKNEVISEDQECLQCQNCQYETPLNGIMPGAIVSVHCQS